MAYHYTRSRARSEVEVSDVEPSDAAPSAATSPLPPSTIEGPNVVAVGGPESVSTESTGPVSVPAHPLPAGSPPFSGGRGVSGPAGPPQVGVSTLGYPSSLAGPLGSSGEQVLPSLAPDAAKASPASAVVDAQSVSSLGAAPRRQQLASRQPTTAATETAAAIGPSYVISYVMLCYVISSAGISH